MSEIVFDGVMKKKDKVHDVISSLALSHSVLKVDSAPLGHAVPATCSI